LRVIASTLFSAGYAVHSRGFSEHNSFGKIDSVVDVFQLWEVDEIIIFCVGNSTFLDAIEYLENVEINTPLTIGGGVESKTQALKLIRAGCERISIGLGEPSKFQLMEEVSSAIGQEAILPVVDCYSDDGEFFTKYGIPVGELLSNFRDWSGEILLQDVARDGLCDDDGVTSILSICRSFPELNFVLSGSAQNVKLQDLFDVKNVTAISIDRFLNSKEGSYPRLKRSMHEAREGRSL
jgi:imidazole glycerol phosphate synthase subunit HisF